MEYKLETDVPLPERTSQYPFEQMSVGHSFFAPGKTPNQLRNAAGHYRKKNGWTFACEARTENGVEGARIWRKS